MQIEIFEVFNNKGKRVFFTYEKECIPPKKHIDLMLKNGDKIKVNGVNTSRKKLNELLK